MRLLRTLLGVGVEYLVGELFLLVWLIGWGSRLMEPAASLTPE